MTRCPTAAGLVLVVLFHSLRGSAQTSSRDVAIATQLFDDAEKLIAVGNPAAACPKYSESQRRDPQLGTLLHLADCWEEIGKTASAWAAFKEAAEVAARRNASGLNEPREKTARARVAALEQRLARLTINVLNAGTPGLEIRQGGELVDRALWGSAVPIDPGVYTVTAHAPGKKQWTQMLEVDPDGGPIEVTIPLLESDSGSMTMAATPAALSSSGRMMDAAESRPTPTRSGTAQRTAGLLLGGGGVATLGVGAVFGLMSNAKASNSEAICPSGVDCTPNEVLEVRGLEEEARTHATRFYAASAIGAALLIGGVVLTLTAPSITSKTPFALRLETWGSTAAAGANLSGRW